MDKQHTDTDDQSQRSGADSYDAYATQGEDAVVESSSPAIPSPTKPSEARVSPPQPAIQSIGQTPGDANPALPETLGYARGEVSTADLLRAREASEEQGLRAAHDEIYETQSPGAQPQEYQIEDKGRPNWPLDRTQPPVEYMNAPHADEPLLSGNPSEYGQSLQGQIDAQVDLAGSQAGAQESRSGLAPTGWSAEEDEYEQREFDRPAPPTDLNMIAPDMPNVPPEEDNG